MGALSGLVGILGHILGDIGGGGVPRRSSRNSRPKSRLQFPSIGRRIARIFQSLNYARQSVSAFDFSIRCKPKKSAPPFQVNRSRTASLLAKAAFAAAAQKAAKPRAARSSSKSAKILFSQLEPRQLYSMFSLAGGWGTSVGVPYQLTVDASGSVAYDVDWGDGSPHSTQIISGSTVFSHTFRSADLTSTITVAGTQGTTTELEDKDIQVQAASSSSGPLPPFRINGPATTTTGTPYILNLNSGGDSISSWTIDWGDGQIGTVEGPRPYVVHDYGDAGVFNISATATDATGTRSAPPLLVSSSTTTTSFGDGTFVPVNAVGESSDFYVLGTRSSDGDSIISKYSSDGTLDASFGDAGTLSGTWSNIKETPDGGFVSAWLENSTSGSVLYVAQYSSDGSADGSFGDGGTVSMTLSSAYNGGIFGVDVDAAGKIAIGMDFSQNSTATDPTEAIVVRLTSAGEADSTFGASGLQTVDQTANALGMRFATGNSAGALAIAYNGNVVLAFSENYSTSGSSQQIQFRILELGTNGVVTNTTIAQGSNWVLPTQVAVDSSGRMIVAGDGRLVRLRSDGSLDPAFGSDGQITSTATSFSAMVVEDSGEIALSEASAGRVWIVSPGGILSTKSLGTGPVRGLVVESNGQVLAIGDGGNLLQLVSLGYVSATEAGGGFHTLSDSFPTDYESLETIGIPSDGSTVSSTTILVEGQTYVLVVSGTLTYQSASMNGYADADYGYANDVDHPDDFLNLSGPASPPPPPPDSPPPSPPPSPPIVDLGVAVSTDGSTLSTGTSTKIPAWLDAVDGSHEPSPDFVYYDIVVGDGEPLSALFNDDDYGDNADGDMTLDIYTRVFATMSITATDGSNEDNSVTTSSPADIPTLYIKSFLDHAGAVFSTADVSPPASPYQVLWSIDGRDFTSEDPSPELFTDGLHTIQATYDEDDDGQVDDDSPDSVPIYTIDVDVSSFGDDPSDPSSSSPPELVTVGLVNLGYVGVTSTFDVAAFHWTEGFDPSNDFQAIVDWGDGTQSTQSVSNSGGYFLAGGTHSYSHEGSYVVTAEILNSGYYGGSFVDTFDASYVDILNGVSRTSLEKSDSHTLSSGLIGDFVVSPSINMDTGAFSVGGGGDGASYFFAQTLSQSNSGADVHESQSDGDISVNLSAGGSFDTTPSGAETDDFALAGLFSLSPGRCDPGGD